MGNICNGDREIIAVWIAAYYGVKMPILDVIGRLDHCKSTGEDKYIARCPAHEDRSPSLTIRELADGRILIHCFAGCSPLDVLTSIGLDWESLYPPELEHYSRPRRERSATVDSIVIEIAEHDRANGKRLSKVDVERYREALKRNPPESSIVPMILSEAKGVPYKEDK
jgi:hypothetical protein